ncbi:MAG: prepilin peptidase, partial [Eubacterium sp.]|nr:prepilin peptidase [Eubacterium sp.]
RLNDLGKYVFLGILCFAALQDFLTRSIENNLLWSAGTVGIVLCILTGRNWASVLLSCSVGVLLLGISYLSDGGIGEGDGWFFMISGFYLDAMENLILLLSGLLLCSCFCLPLAVKSIRRHGEGRKNGVPFLPFLLPAGMWITVTAEPVLQLKRLL